MQLLAQHGYGNGDKIERGLEEGILDGVIFGAKDISPDKLVSTLQRLENAHPESLRILDPQFYATMIAAQPGARLRSLAGEGSHPYFEARRRRDLEQNEQVVEDIIKVLNYQLALPVSALIAPNIVIRRSFDSIEGTIAKTFLRCSADTVDIDDGRPVYATIAVSATALNDKIEMQNFLQEITELENPPDGFYLLLENPDSSINSPLTEPDALSRWMLMTHTLKINGFRVINGYTDALSPYFAAAGSDAVATGWYNTQKVFTLKKFEPVSDFARRPIQRYMSAALLKSIRYTELHDLRGRFPEVMNGLSFDDCYLPGEGSAPDSPTNEALQNWQGIKAMNMHAVEGDVYTSLENCRGALDEAEEIYGRIQEYGLTMRDRSSAAHIEAIREELDAFEDLAEL